MKKWFVALSTLVLIGTFGCEKKADVAADAASADAVGPTDKVTEPGDKVEEAVPADEKTAEVNLTDEKAEETIPTDEASVPDEAAPADEKAEPEAAEEVETPAD